MLLDRMVTIIKATKKSNTKPLKSNILCIFFPLGFGKIY